MNLQPPEIEKTTFSHGFLAIKFDGTETDPTHGKQLIHTLRTTGLNISCLVEEEDWGNKPHVNPLVEAERRIDESEFLIIDFSSGSGYGMGCEAGYARAQSKPVIGLVPEGTELKPTRRDSATHILQYRELENIPNVLLSILADIST